MAAQVEEVTVESNPRPFRKQYRFLSRLRCPIAQLSTFLHRRVFRNTPYQKEAALICLCLMHLTLDALSFMIRDPASYRRSGD